MSAIRALAAAAAFVLAGLVHAAGGPEMRMEPFLGDVHDEAQLQRGAKLFVNYCLNCHSAQHMRYNRLEEIGLTEDQIRDYLIFTGVKVGERMTTGLMTKDGKSWFGGPVPDLTLEARVRGTQWVYNYLLGFYRDDTPTGWNNLVFPGVSMPHVLWQLGGSQKLVVTDYKTHDEAKAALIAAKGMGVIEPLAKGGYAVKTLALDSPGQMSAAEYRATVQDLVTFMEYMSEPAKLKRRQIGLVVLMFLGVLFVLALWLKKEYWKDVR